MYGLAEAAEIPAAVVADDGDYVGCFADDLADRVLEDKKWSRHMTLEVPRKALS